MSLVIGEDYPKEVKKINNLELCVRENGKIFLYADINLPYVINHIEYLEIPDDPRYILYEGYDFETKASRYTCEVKPFGKLKGVYRILNGERIKIMPIEPLYELEEKTKVFTLKKNNH